MRYDVIIIGNGASGVSASIYLSRARLKTLVIGNPEKSQLMEAYKVENYMGFPEGITGKNLLDMGMKQSKKYGTEFTKGEVVDVKKKPNGFIVRKEDGKTFESKFLIISTGMSIRLSGIVNEEKFLEKGIHYSAESDGAFYSGKKLVVMGNGNHAAEEALDLTEFTQNITIISNSDKFSFSKKMQAEIKRRKIKLVNSKVKEFFGDQRIGGLVLENGRRIKSDAVFMGIGAMNALEFASDLKIKTRKNLIVVDNANRTSVAEVYAVGNCSSNTRQIAKNVGDGCNAAIDIIKSLKRRDLYVDYGTLYGVHDKTKKVNNGKKI